MVLGVFGLPGAGKTTFLAQCAVRSLAGKRVLGIPPHDRVFTTFALTGCYKLLPEYIGTCDLSGSLLLIDEISGFWDARDWKNFPTSTRVFFQLHRHYNCDIIMCSQNYADADARIRNLCSDYYLLEDTILPHISVVKRISRSIYVKDGSIHDDYRIVPPILWRWVFRKRYYQYFDSYVQTVHYRQCDFELWDTYNVTEK